MVFVIFLYFVVEYLRVWTDLATEQSFLATEGTEGTEIKNAEALRAGIRSA